MQLCYAVAYDHPSLYLPDFGQGGKHSPFYGSTQHDYHFDQNDRLIVKVLPAEKILVQCETRQ
jgi:hypothetical protein